MYRDMKIILAALALLAITLLVVVSVWRWLDHNADAVERHRLISLQPVAPVRFDPASIKGLPEAARRYFLFSIAPGTPLQTVAEISMAGQFSLGNKESPNYMDMRAQQTLAAPYGFVWKMHASSGAMRISGSDSASWTRFWIFGVVPVARMGGDSDHTRSAFGRYVAEAVFWTPAALLPGPGIEWQSVNENTARVIITHENLQQDVELIVDDVGRPTTVQFSRWSDANPEKIYRLQPFGGYLSEYRRFSGFTLPTHIEAGNNFGTDEYFPFYVADVTNVAFPRSE